MGSQILVFFITNVDDVFVGRLLNPTQLGQYGLAYKLSNLPATQITRLVGQVMFPTFSKLQDDTMAFRQVYFKSLRYVSMLSIPVSVGTVIFAGAFIRTLYGAKWTPAILPLQLLGIYGLIRSVAANMGNVFKAGGKPQWLTLIAIWRLATMLALLWPATYYYGIVGVSALSAGVAIVDFIISVVLVNRIIRASVREYLEVLGPITIISLIAAGLAKVAQKSLGDGHDFIGLSLGGCLMVLIYAVVLWLFDPDLRRQVAYILGEFGVGRLVMAEQEGPAVALNPGSESDGDEG